MSDSRQQGTGRLTHAAHGLKENRARGGVCRLLTHRQGHGLRRRQHLDLPGLQEVWVRIPLVELIFPSFFPSYLSSSHSDLHTPPFFQSTRREIGSETTDNLSEDTPVKNAYLANAHALILTHPYVLHTSCKCIGCAFSP